MIANRVKGRFSVMGIIAMTTLAMSAGLYRAHAEMPMPVYETTVSGINEAAGWDVATDSSGNAYVLSEARDGDGVHLGLAVAKIGPNGQVLWVTPISGSDHDAAGGIALNSAGEVCVAGWTDSADFPLVNALDPTLTGFRDAFIMKLSGQDGSIVYSTFLGGDYVDSGYDIVVTASDEMIVVGTTESSDFPTVNPIQGQLNSPPYQYADLFITRLSADGSQILYSTYLGSSHDERWASVALDSQERIYIATNVENGDFPTVNPILGFAGGLEDVVVARLAADGSAIEYATYLGGSDWDYAGRIGVDSNGAAYVAGTTRSINFPTTPGAYQETFVGGILSCGSPPFDPLHNCEDGFVAKLSPDGSYLEYSTYLAGTQVDEARSAAVDAFGRVHVAGYTYSTDFPGAAMGEVFVARLSADGSALDYTVARDSITPNASQSVAVDEDGGVYFAASVNLPPQLYVAKFEESRPTKIGDADCSGQVDFGDIGPFVDALGGEAYYAALYPGCIWLHADINGDGTVTFEDIGPFVDLLTGSSQVLELNFAGLEPLGAASVYEGWLIVNSLPVSTGRFNLDGNGQTAPTHFLVDATDAAQATAFVLTIEPALNDPPEPAATHVLAGAWDGTMAPLSIGHPAALGDDFSLAAGDFILETPTTSGTPGDYDQGIWWLDPAGGPGPSLSLPMLPAGWVYEGWVVDMGGPISTGRFVMASGADSDGAGASSGPDPAPPFPGQDFITPPLSLIGLTAVISVEPEPDDSPAPFALKPLVDMTIEDVGPGVLQGMANNAAAAPTGAAILQ